MSTDATSPFLGRRHLVVGASKGLGLAVARELVDRGAEVVISSRSESSLVEAAASLGDRASSPGRSRSCSRPSPHT